MDEPEPEVCGMHASRGRVVGLFIQLLKEDCPFQKTLGHFTQWVWQEARHSSGGSLGCSQLLEGAVPGKGALFCLYLLPLLTLFLQTLCPEVRGA